MKTNPNCILRTEDNGIAILFNPETGHIHTLNPTSAFIWKAIQAGWTLNTIGEKLAKATGISLSIILDDIRDFVKELQVNGYILNDNSQ